MRILLFEINITITVKSKGVPRGGPRGSG